MKPCRERGSFHIDVLPFSRTGISKLSIKGQIVNIVGFEWHVTLSHKYSSLL